MKIPSVEDLEQLVKQPGIKLWHDRQRNYIRIRLPEGRTINIPYDEDVYNRLKAAREEYKKGGTAKVTSKPVMSDLTLWNTVISRRRPLIESLISKVAWLQEALLDVGMNTLLFAFTISKEADPNKITELLGKIRDKDEFVGYITNKLISLYMSSKGFEEVEELRRKIIELEAENAILRETVERLRSVNQDLSSKLELAMSLMDKPALTKYARILTIKSVTVSYPGPEEVGAR